MLTEDHIPQAWKDALSIIQNYHPEAVIGGGCLRDLDNAVEVKDIDIFVRCERPNGRGAVADQLEALHEKLSADCPGLNVADIDADAWYPVGDGNDVVGFFDMDLQNGDPAPKVQIIMVDFDCSRIVERFDFGICRIAYDGKVLTVAPEYRSDKAIKRFRLCLPRADKQLAASVHRYARLVRKYEGWTFVAFGGEDDFEDML